MTKVGLLLLITAAFAPLATSGVLTPLNSAAGVGATDFVDWGQLGADFTDVTGPFVAASNLLTNVTVANGVQDFYAIQEGNTWTGNFTPGDNLLFDQAGGAFTITFPTPIRAIGTQFQPVTQCQFCTVGIPFTVYITAFGAGNVNFGTVSTTGASNNAEDGSAVFLGVMSSQRDIVQLSFNVQVNGADDPFAINRVMFSNTAPEPVPEPSSLALAGIGLAAALWRMRRASAR
jgi:hypothetical protein